MDDLYLTAADRPGPSTRAWFNAVTVLLILSGWATAWLGGLGGLLVLVVLSALLVQLHRRRQVLALWEHHSGQAASVDAGPDAY